MSDDGEQTVRWYDWDEVTPSVAVIQTLSDVTGRDVTAIERFTRTMDPDALDGVIIGADDSALRVAFEHDGHEVVVRGDGRIAVTPL